MHTIHSGIAAAWWSQMNCMSGRWTIKGQDQACRGVFQFKVAKDIRPFLAITLQQFLAKLAFQLGHSVPKSIAHFLYNTIMGVGEVGTRPMVALTSLWKCEVKTILTISNWKTPQLLCDFVKYTSLKGFSYRYPWNWSTNWIWWWETWCLRCLALWWITGMKYTSPTSSVVWASICTLSQICM